MNIPFSKIDIPNPKCTPHRPFVKLCRGIKHNRLYSNYSEVAVEPAFVKWYRKILANRGFCKKKLDTHSDTLCIKIGVQLWQGQKDLNPRHAVLETAALPTELYP